MTILEDKTWKEVIKVNEVKRAGPYSDRIGVLIRRGRGRDTRSRHLSFSFHTHTYTHTHRRKATRKRHSKKVAICKPGREASL